MTAAEPLHDKKTFSGWRNDVLDLQLEALIPRSASPHDLRILEINIKAKLHSLRYILVPRC